MPETDMDKLPLRWRDLDKRTIEWIARLNENERSRLIEVSHLDPKQIERLERFLSLPDDKWDAGFKIVTRSVLIASIVKRVPTLIIGLAAILVAINQIWGWVAPYLPRVFK